MKNAVVVSGAGRYSDPWHPFDETSAAIAEVLQDHGLAARVAEDVDATLAALDGTDLLVLNIGAPQYEDETVDAAVRSGLLRHVDRGGPILSMHVSSTSLSAVPEWEAITGGLWVRGTTMHPDLGRAMITVHSDRHPIVAGLQDFELEDERYSYMRVSPDVVPLLTHEHDGIEHPLFWPWTYGRARVVYDALGHDGRSYRSPEHRAILGRSARWLVRDL